MSTTAGCRRSSSKCGIFSSFTTTPASAPSRSGGRDQPETGLAAPGHERVRQHVARASRRAARILRAWCRLSSVRCQRTVAGRSDSPKARMSSSNCSPWIRSLAGSSSNTTWVVLSGLHCSSGRPSASPGRATDFLQSARRRRNTFDALCPPRRGILHRA